MTFVVVCVCTVLCPTSLFLGLCGLFWIFDFVICCLVFDCVVRVMVPGGVVACEGRMVDALADRTDEGRVRLR